jgi:hypothetical protein
MVDIAEHRTLEARYDHVHDRYLELHQTLTALVDAVFSLPDAGLWTAPQHDHLRLVMREALRVLGAADDPAPGGLYG